MFLVAEERNLPYIFSICMLCSEGWRVACYYLLLWEITPIFYKNSLRQLLLIVSKSHLGNLVRIQTLSYG